MGPQLANVRLGDVFNVIFPHSTQDRPSFKAMVTQHYGDVVDVTPIDLDADDKPRRDSVRVSQANLDLPILHPGRQVLHPYPEYRRWAANPIALLSFSGYPPPMVPTGLNMGEFARHNQSMFLLTSKTPYTQRDDTATYRPPFYDHLNQAIVRQDVTVFRLNDGKKMGARRLHATAQDSWPVLPDGATFTQVDEGLVHRADEFVLTLGTRATGLRDYQLRDSSFFAIETKVLVQAGLAG